MTTMTKRETPNGVLYWLCRAVFLEAIRRREISAVLLFMGLFIVGAITSRFVGSESDSAAAFVLNLGLSLSWILSLLVAILLGARQFPDELEQRSIYPLLAKPVSRRQYLLGKWLAVTIAGCGTALVLNILASAASPWPGGTSALLIVQGFILELLAVGAATAIVIALSIRLPKALAVTLTALVVFVGTTLITMVQSAAATTSFRGPVRWLAGYIPSFGKLDLVNAITAGMGAVSPVDFVARIGYAVVITAFFLAIAIFLLERKPL